MLRLTMVDDGDPAPRFSGRRPTREGMDLKKIAVDSKNRTTETKSGVS
jgi:hypothetical protein